MHSLLVKLKSTWLKKQHGKKGEKGKRTQRDLLDYPLLSLSHARKFEKCRDFVEVESETLVMAKILWVYRRQDPFRLLYAVFQESSTIE